MKLFNLKGIAPLCALFLLVGFVYGQRSSAVSGEVFRPENTPGWMRIASGIHMSASEVVSDRKQDLGLTEQDHMQLVRSDADPLGWTHHRYIQTHNGIPVYGAEIIVHSFHGASRSLNGHWVKGMKASTQAVVSSDHARETAILRSNGRHFMWEDARAETQLKRIRRDESATYFPQPELVLMDPEFSGDPSRYKLAWKVDVYSVEPLSRNWFFIDAQSGEILFRENRIHSDDSKGTAVTLYSDTVAIVTDSLAPDSFRLREMRNGVSIETYDMNRGLFYGDAVDFTDDDNFWNNINAQKDEAATDGHWGTEMTNEYFWQYHGRNSFDNQGSPMISYLHYRNGYQNAFWNGEFMTYGDGAGNSKPFCALDVCGHEFTHGVTQFSAGLIYKDEYGALNESFSDIFGYMVEWMGDSTQVNWKVGEDLGTLRDMSDPKKFSNPDTYKGEHWHTTSDDQGGVHTNSGVQNHWFYLLTDGDSSVNDNGDAYVVKGIGRHKAAAIAYRNLAVYLGKTSEYADARQGAIWAAEDLFGTCSEEMRQTAMAWYAVGVGDSLTDQDIGPVVLATAPSSCHLTASEPVSVSIKNQGCQVVNAGDTIYCYYQVQGGSIIMDTLVLQASLNAGDTVVYVFDQTVDLSATGNYVLNAWVSFSRDSIAANDSLKAYTVSKWDVQNDNFALSSIVAPLSGCGLLDQEDVVVEVRFEGCDSAATGTKVPLAFSLNGGAPQRDTLVLSSTLLPGTSVPHTFSTKASLIGSHSFLLDAWTDFPGDSQRDNDTACGRWLFRPVALSNDRITFEDPVNVTDSFYTVIQSRARAYVSDTSVAAGQYAFQMTGSIFAPIRTAYGYKRPHDLNAWTVNDDYRSEMCLCIDATTWSTANLTFDMRQSYNGVYSTQAGGPFPYTSNLRLTVNGTQIGDQYNPLTKNSDVYTFHHVNLDAYAGTSFQLCFEAKNYEGIEGEKYPQLYNGDNAFIDNINVVETVNVGEEEKAEAGWQWKTYPNPTTDRWEIWIYSPDKQDGTLQVTNMLGQQMYYIQKAGIVAGYTTLSVDAGNWTPGIYYISLTTPTGSRIQKVVKQ